MTDWDKPKNQHIKMLNDRTLQLRKVPFSVWLTLAIDLPIRKAVIEALQEVKMKDAEKKEVSR